MKFDVDRWVRRSPLISHGAARWNITATIRLWSSRKPLNPHCSVFSSSISASASLITCRPFPSGAKQTRFPFVNTLLSEMATMPKSLFIPGASRLSPSCEAEEDGNPVFVRIWKIAAEALRSANRVVIVGYSLPPADSAAWTLLLANCDATRTTVVNPDPSVMRRYRRLLSQDLPKMSDWFPPQNFGDWVAGQIQATSRA